MKRLSALMLIAVVSASAAFAQTTEKNDSVKDSLYIDPILLNEVEVVTQKPVVKMETDKMTYNVQQDAEAKSSTVLDMLRKVPMVTVDGQDNITVNGSSSFKIYVDGRPNPMYNSNPGQIFKAMPASTVKKIEIITNPGAKYDAEGTTCILNITMNQQVAGSNDCASCYNGSVSLTASTRGLLESATISGQKDRWTYNAMLMSTQNKQNGTSVSFDREYSDGSKMNYYQKGDNKTPITLGNFSLGYQIDSMSVAHASLNLMRFNLRNEGHPTTTFSGGSYGNGFSYSNQMLMKMNNTSLNASADWSRFLNSEHSSSIALTYQFSNTPQRNREYTYYDYDYSNIQQFNISDRYTDNHTRATEHTIQLDYTTPLAKGQTLSLGAKYINHLNKSDSRYYNINGSEEIYNADNSTIFQNRQQIGAAYAEYNGSFGKFSTREGLRYEHTWEKIEYSLGKGDKYSKNYGTLVPSASLTFSPSYTSNIGMSYAMNISRPGISYLNPYVDRSNPTSISYGNPSLDVVKTHSVNLVANYYSPKFLINFTAGGQFCNNAIGQYSFIDDDNLLNTTYVNDVHDRRLNLNTYMRLTPTKTTVVSLSAGANYVDMHSSRLEQSNHGWQYNAYINVEQKLPWHLQWTNMAMIQGRRYSLQGYSSGMSIYTTSLTRSFLNDRLNVGLRYMVPFTGKLNIKQHTKSSTYSQAMNIKVPIQTISLTLTYNFGNTKKKFQQHESRVKSEYGEAENNAQKIGSVQMGR